MWIGIFAVATCTYYQNLFTIVIYNFSFISKKLILKIFYVNMIWQPLKKEYIINLSDYIKKQIHNPYPAGTESD